MVRVNFIQTDGEVRNVEAAVGASLMQAAIKHGVAGIEAECGGTCSCATCHVYVEQAWSSLVGQPSPMEDGMLEFAEGVRPVSRLSCQIKVTSEMEGLVVRVAPAPI